MNPASARPAAFASLRRPGIDAGLAAARVALLGLAGAIEGLLLANSPVLERYAAVRLGPDGILIDVTLLCVAVLGTLGAAAALAPWAQAVFVGFLVGAMSWSLAESSLHPFWLFSNKGVWRPHAPNAAVMAGHVVAIVLVCAAALGQALQQYRAAGRAQRFATSTLDQHTKRLTIAGLAVLGAATGAAIPLILVLDGAAAKVEGAVRGQAAFMVLVGSAILLLVGLGLMAAQERGKKAKPASDGPR